VNVPLAVIIPADVFYVVHSTGVPGAREHDVSSDLYETHAQANSELVRLKGQNPAGAYDIWKSSTYVEPLAWSVFGGAGRRHRRSHRLLRSSHGVRLPAAFERWGAVRSGSVRGESPQAFARADYLRRRLIIHRTRIRQATQEEMRARPASIFMTDVAAAHIAGQHLDFHRRVKGPGFPPGHGLHLA
jgi:hypothetical protein